MSPHLVSVGCSAGLEIVVVREGGVVAVAVVTVAGRWDPRGLVRRLSRQSVWSFFSAALTLGTVHHHQWYLYETVHSH